MVETCTDGSQGGEQRLEDAHVQMALWPPSRFAEDVVVGGLSLVVVFDVSGNLPAKQVRSPACCPNSDTC